MSQGIALFDAQGRMQLFNQCYADWSEAPPCALHARVALQSLGDFQKQRGDFGADRASLGESCFRPLGEESAGKDLGCWICRTRSGGSFEVKSRCWESGGMVSTFSDVTDHEAAIDTLKSERQRLAQLIHGTRAGTWSIDWQIGRGKTDERWAANLGYAVAELGAWGVGEWQKLLDSQDVDRVQTLQRRHLRGETAF